MSSNRLETDLTYFVCNLDKIKILLLIHFFSLWKSKRRRPQFKCFRRLKTLFSTNFACSFASLTDWRANKRLKRWLKQKISHLSDSPSHFETRSDEDTEKNVELFASVATAFARYDFPLPGGYNIYQN